VSLDEREGWRVALIESALAAVVFALLVAVVNPAGNFPALDDWDFAYATWRFAETGSYQFSAFTAVSLRLQVIWGALWTLAFGKSFDVLRLSTLFLAFFSVVTLLAILRRLRCPRVVRALTAVAFIANPLFFWSAFTYMTEVPFVCMSILAMYFHLRALKEERLIWMIAAAVAVTGSFFIRQTGIINAAPILIVLLLRRHERPRWKALAMASVIPVAIFSGTYLFRPEWLSGSTSEFATHAKMWSESTFRLPQMLRVALDYTVFNFQHGAVFLAPLAFLLLPGSLQIARRSRVAMGGLAVILVLFLFRASELVSLGYTLPYRATDAFCCNLFGGYIVHNLGVGPPTMPDVWKLGYPFPYEAPIVVPIVLTFVGAIVGAVLIWRLLLAIIRGFRDHGEVAGSALLPALHAGLSSAALLASGLYVDRYSLDSLWALAIFIPQIVTWSRSVRITAGVTAVVLLLFSVMATQEYLRWNRARWKAIDSLRARGASPAEIEAGSEPFQHLILVHRPESFRRRAAFELPPPRFWITFHPLPGGRELDRIDFDTFLGSRHYTMYIQEVSRPPSSVRRSGR
jgi:hypothetical protein